MSLPLAGHLPDEVAIQRLGVFRLSPPRFCLALVQFLESPSIAGYVPSHKRDNCI